MYHALKKIDKFFPRSNFFLQYYYSIFLQIIVRILKNPYNHANINCNFLINAIVFLTFNPIRLSTLVIALYQYILMHCHILRRARKIRHLYINNHTGSAKFFIY